MNRQMLFVSLLVLIAYYVFSFKTEKMTVTTTCNSNEHKCAYEDCSPWLPDCEWVEYCKPNGTPCDPGDRSY